MKVNELKGDADGIKDVYGDPSYYHAVYWDRMFNMHYTADYCISAIELHDWEIGNLMLPTGSYIVEATGSYMIKITE